MQKTYTKTDTPTITNEKCSVIYALEIIGGKWKLPIIWKLSKQEQIRYNELKRTLGGITNRMLTKCLSELEQDGIIIRTSVDDTVLHVSYSLSPSGQKLIPALEIIGKWGRDLINEKS